MHKFKKNRRFGKGGLPLLITVYTICAFSTVCDVFVLGLLLLMVRVLLVTPQIRTEFRQLGQIEILCAWRCDS